MATFCTWKDNQPADKFADVKATKKTPEAAEPKPVETPTETETETAPPTTPAETAEPSPEESADPIIATGEEEPSNVEVSVPDIPTDNPALQAELSALGIEGSGLQEDETALDMDMLGVTLPSETVAEENGEEGTDAESNLDLDALRDAGIDLDF